MSCKYFAEPTVAALRALCAELGDMPNLEQKTLGGEFFWDTVFEVGGWRVQVNRIFANARILDENDVRRAWGSREVMEEKLRRIKRESFLEAGDVIGIKRPAGYEHYAVYIGSDRVIHYAGRGGDLICPTVHEAPIEEFLGGGRSFFVLNFPRGCGKPSKIFSSAELCRGALLEDFDSASVYKGGGKFRLYSPAETVERAKSRVGESRYNLVTNNCEHFSVWCKTGIHQSYQVNRILQLLEHLDEPHTAFVIGG